MGCTNGFAVQLLPANSDRHTQSSPVFNPSRRLVVVSAGSHEAKNEYGQSPPCRPRASNFSRIPRHMEVFHARSLRRSLDCPSCGCSFPIVPLFLHNLPSGINAVSGRGDRHPMCGYSFQLANENMWPANYSACWPKTDWSLGNLGVAVYIGDGGVLFRLDPAVGKVYLASDVCLGGKARRRRVEVHRRTTTKSQSGRAVDVGLGSSGCQADIPSASRKYDTMRRPSSTR
nr:hypothetical protein CFP56_21998 [Quercus suber]